MKRTISSLFTVILMLILAMSIAEAQMPQNFFSKLYPDKVLTSTQERCLKMGFGLNYFGFCAYQRQLPWVAYGGNWMSIFRGGNSKIDGSIPGQIALQVQVLGVKVTPYIPSYVKDNRSVSVLPTGTVAWALFPKERVRAEFLYPSISFDGGQTSVPDPDRLGVGSLLLEYSAPEPEPLVGLSPSSVSFLERDSSGAFLGNATELEKPASEYWRGDLSETFDREANWKDAQTTSMAICNPNEEPIAVDITLYDDNGGFVATVGMYLQKHETNGFLLRDLFGDKMFPGGHDFIGYVVLSRRAWSILNPGEFQGSNAVMFQRVGSSMGNLPLDAIAKP